MPKFSIVIPALNEEKYIQKTLISLKNQTFNDYEVIVVLDKKLTKDRTGSIAKKYGAKILSANKQGVAFARDLGAKHTKGEILVFTDADTILPSNFLEKVEREFRDEQLIALSGATMPYDGDLLIKMEYILWNLVRFLRIHLSKVLPAPGTFTVIRRKVFYDIGGFLSRSPHPYLDLSQCDGIGRSLKELKLGKTKISLSIWVFPSARRYKNLGFIKFNIRYSYLIEILFGNKPPSLWILLQKSLDRLDYVKDLRRSDRCILP